MMKTSSKMLFFLTTLISTMLVVSSTNWLNMWIGLEINLMSFIPFMFKSKNNFMSQSSMMYFLTQSIASTMFIIIMMTNSYLLTNMEENMWMKFMLTITMMMKMGMPPFHLWFPEMMSKISWTSCMMMMTWQKIAPMYILSQSIENNKIMTSMIILSTMTGAIMGLNHTSIRKIMAYSSINHMGWLVACTMMFKKLWVTYMILYSSMILMMCWILHKHNIMSINQFNIKSMSMSEKLTSTIMMLSIGGMPPFLGFMPKWITIEYMIMSNEFMMLTMMALSSIITMSYYLRMTSSMNMVKSHSQKWEIPDKSKKTSTSSTMYINIMLPMFILLMNFM